MFWLKFGSLRPVVILKIRWSSPKPNQLFIVSICYIRANLVIIRPTFHKISCTQNSVMSTLMLTPTGSAPKTLCQPPCWWGDITTAARRKTVGGNYIWASSWDYGIYHKGDQRKLRRACAFAQSRHSLRCSHIWSREVDEGSDQKSDI